MWILEILISQAKHSFPQAWSKCNSSALFDSLMIIHDENDKCLK